MKESFAQSILNEVREGYDIIASSFSETRTAPWSETERFRDFVHLGDAVIDIGCGNGRSYPLFAGMAIDYEGVDTSQELIDEAKRLHGDMLASFCQADMRTLPYEDSAFNVALCVAVLHHMPSERFRMQALREANRVLMPGGVLLMTNWYLWQKPHLRKVFASGVSAVFGSGYDFGDVRIPWKRNANVSRYCHAFTRRELRRLLERAGFEVEEQYLSDGKRSRNIVTIARKME